MKNTYTNCACCGEDVPKNATVPFEGERICVQCAVEQLDLDIRPCAECGRLGLPEDMVAQGLNHICTECAGDPDIANKHEDRRNYGPSILGSKDYRIE